MLPIRSWARDRRILLKDQCVLHNPAQVRLAQDDNLSTHLLRIGPINLSAKPVWSAMANFQGPIRRANRRVHREEITQNDLWELAADSDFGKETFFVCWLFGPSPKRSCNAGLCRCHEGICRLKRLQMFNALSKFNTYP